MKLHVEFDVDLGDMFPLTPKRVIAYVKRVIRETAQTAEWKLLSVHVRTWTLETD